MTDEKDREAIESAADNWADWSTIIKITIIGMWGHDAYSENYRYSGAYKHYPNTVYRFTKFGASSIDKEKYMDIEIPMKDLKVGYSNGLFKVDKITNDKNPSPAVKGLVEALKFYWRTGTWENYGTIALEDSGVTAGEALATYEASLGKKENGE